MYIVMVILVMLVILAIYLISHLNPLIDKLIDKIKSQEQNSWLLILIFNYLIINSVSSSNKWQWFISNTSFNGWPGAKSSLDGTDAIIGSPSIAV